ncbi:hypothetical protein RCH14_004434 [Massilia sp. MP_M2]|uniref:hypothetical protein n=1 Tax=Massilia sp. MP_M2 TaxID=3071713 RepID=UPI00319E426F
MPKQIPLDPKLRAGFDQTPNEQRSKAELDAWWDHPYAISLPDGRIMVRCLNGGAWDRSTHLGVADNYEDACVLAEQEQAKWVGYRGRPVFYHGELKSALVVMPQRPDSGMRTLLEVESAEQAAEYMRENYPEPIAEPAAAPKSE